jgi:hypothetical protein
MTTEIWGGNASIRQSGCRQGNRAANNSVELTLHSLPLVDAKEQKSHE